MVDAHVHSIFIVGQPFRTPGLYDFGKQDITDRVYDQLPIMMKHRMTPPPPETYTLHRKLSGAYLLCMKLKAKVPAYQLFRDIALKKA
jgi:aarF domain-containing kinase